MTAVFSLSTHAHYACRHSGACCTSGWPIPVERDTAAWLRARLADGTLVGPGFGQGRSSPADACRLLVEHPDAPADTPATAGVDETGACVFYERHRHRCAIHRQLGPMALPVACRQFPRVSLLDRRGLFVTLSHYCPTAAATLFDDDELRVVATPPAFPCDFEFDPLDARLALPPLLHPTVMLDLDIFDRWERAAVALLAERGRTPAAAVAAVATMTEAFRRWTPGSADPARVLEEAVAEASVACDPVAAEIAELQDANHLRLVREAIPEPLRPTLASAGDRAARRFDADWNGYGAVVRRYLAARLFGSWLAYQGPGLRTIAFSLAVALSVLRVEATVACVQRNSDLGRDALILAIRQTDNLLLHLAGRQALANLLGQVEQRV